jgi:hypothetical protein
VKSSNLAGGIALLALAIAQPTLAAPPTPEGPAVPGGTMLSLKQLTVTIDPDGDAKANGEKVAAFQSATLGIFSCADAEGAAQATGATVQSVDALPLTALPPALRDVVATMKIGTATQVFGDRAKGQVKVLVLCGRR